MAHLFDVWIWIRVLLRGNVNCYSVSWLRWRGFGSFSEKIRKHKLATDHLSYVHNWCQSTELECDFRRAFMWTDTFLPRAQCPCPGTWSRRCTRVLNGTWILGVPVCERNTILCGCLGTSTRTPRCEHSFNLRLSSDAVLHMSRIECKWGRTKDFAHLHSIRFMWSTASVPGLNQVQNELASCGK